MWIQRSLAWGAILIVLLYRNPGINSYENFGTLFDLVSSNFLFGLLGISLITSLFIVHPPSVVYLFVPVASGGGTYPHD